MKNKEIQELIRKIEKDLTKLKKDEYENYFNNRIIDFSEDKDKLINETTRFCKNCRDIIFYKDKQINYCSYYCKSTYKVKKEKEECLVEKYLNK